MAKKAKQSKATKKGKKPKKRVKRRVKKPKKKVKRKDRKSRKNSGDVFGFGVGLYSTPPDMGRPSIGPLIDLGLNKKTKRKKSGGNCLSSFCNHEKCHHLKFIRTLREKLETHNMSFFASLIPYQQVYHPAKYGIIKGMPDFYIARPFKNEKGDVIYTGLYIELKTLTGSLSVPEKTHIKKILDEGDACVGVCHGVVQCRVLLEAWLNPKTTKKKIEDLCWSGKTKKAIIFKPMRNVPKLKTGSNTSSKPKVSRKYRKPKVSRNYRRSRKYRKKSSVIDLCDDDDN